MKLSAQTNTMQRRKRPRAYLSLICSYACLMAIALVPGVAVSQTAPRVIFGPGEITKTLQISRDQITDPGPFKVVVGTQPWLGCGFPDPRAALQAFITRHPARSQAEPIIEQLFTAATASPLNIFLNVWSVRNEFADTTGAKYIYEEQNVVFQTAQLQQGVTVTALSSCLSNVEISAWIREYVRVLKLYYVIP